MSEMRKPWDFFKAQLCAEAFMFFCYIFYGKPNTYSTLLVILQFPPLTRLLRRLFRIRIPRPIHDPNRLRRPLPLLLANSHQRHQPSLRPHSRLPLRQHRHQSLLRSHPPRTIPLPVLRNNNRKDSLDRPRPALLGCSLRNLLRNPQRHEFLGLSRGPVYPAVFVYVSPYFDVGVGLSEGCYASGGDF